MGPSAELSRPAKSTPVASAFPRHFALSGGRDFRFGGSERVHGLSATGLVTRSAGDQRSGHPEIGMPGSTLRPHNGSMNATDRVYRNIEILPARVWGATGPELSRRFELTERQVRRVLIEMRATRRGQDIEAAHLLAQSRLMELYGTVDLLRVKLRELSDVQGLAGLGDLILEYFYEIREVEELLGRFPKEIDWKFKGSDSGRLWMRFKSGSSSTPEPGMSFTTSCTPSSTIGSRVSSSVRVIADTNL